MKIIRSSLQSKQKNEIKMYDKINLLIIADPSSPHTIRWANSINSFGIDVSIFGLYDYDISQYDKNIEITV